MDTRELIEAGLYDPGAPRADEMVAAHQVGATADVDLPAYHPLNVEAFLAVRAGRLPRPHRLHAHGPGARTRIVNLAQPGTIFVTSGVRDRALDDGGYRFEPAGEHALAGFDDPTIVFRLERV